MERFKLTRDLDRIKVEDTLNGVACEFDEGFFNESQKFYFFGDGQPDVAMLSRCASEMGDWLKANHYDLLFPEDEGEDDWEDEELDAEEEMLLEILSFEEGLEDVYILAKEELKNGATFYLCSLIYAGGKEMNVSFVHYDGQDWIFTPCDWQGFMPIYADDIEKIDWRVNDTDHKGMMFAGLPMLWG